MRFRAVVFLADKDQEIASGTGSSVRIALNRADKAALGFLLSNPAVRDDKPISDLHFRVGVSEDGVEMFVTHGVGLAATVSEARAMDRKSRAGNGR